MKYNLFERLNKENEKHKLVIDDDHVYTINNSAAAIVTLQSIVKNNTEDGEVEIKKLYDIIGVGLGKEAREYIEKQEYTIQALSTIVSAISAAASNQTLEEFEKESENKNETPSDK